MSYTFFLGNKLPISRLIEDKLNETSNLIIFLSGSISTASQISRERKEIACQFGFGNEEYHHFRPDTIT
ncbi:hypothetical protein VNO80_30042 [Phaseolus coccineus]|uniref:Uncharacterized protein n=1 Tax=Phaseolus coccineus TaxID=3886 RepID=A0AAN9LF66_PHACN